MARYQDTFVCVRVYNNANININDSTWTALTFNTERYDTDTIHSTGANTGRLTATTAGKYNISGTVQFAADATGQRGVRIFLNGATIIADDFDDASGAGAWIRTISTDYNLAATDYVELQVYQSSGGGLNCVTVSAYTPEFMMHRIVA